MRLSVASAASQPIRLCAWRDILARAPNSGSDCNRSMIFEWPNKRNSGALSARSNPKRKSLDTILTCGMFVGSKADVAAVQHAAQPAARVLDIRSKVARASSVLRATLGFPAMRLSLAVLLAATAAAGPVDF